jgi:hypothetical protein
MLIIEIITTQLASVLEKNSKLIANGDTEINAPIINKIGGIKEGIILNILIMFVSKNQPIKNIVKPIVITEDSA